MFELKRKNRIILRRCVVLHLHLYQQQIFDNSFMEIRYGIFLIDFPTLVAWEIVHSAIFNLLKPFFPLVLDVADPVFFVFFGGGGFQQHSHISKFNQLL